MEGHGKVVAPSVTDSACAEEGAEEEGGSHFQNLLQLPEPSAASNMQIISLREIDLPSANLESWVNHPSSGQGSTLPVWTGRLGPTRTPTQLLSPALL